MATDSTSKDIAQRIAELLDRLSRLTRELQYVDGLNPAQWEALRFIARANQYSKTPSALADFLGTTKGTTSQTLISLENKGLIKRFRSTVDKRMTRIELTDAGRALLCNDPVLKIESMAGGMETDVGVPLVQGLSRLLREMQREVGAKVFGVCELCSNYCETTPVAPAAVERRCGLTGEPLPEGEQVRICVNFTARPT